MADRESVLKERKKAKFLWTHFGKGVLNSIEERIDPEFAVFYFEDYTAEASRVLRLCTELATYDKVDSLEETENVVFIENIQKQTETIISRFITYRKFYKENAVESRENNGKDDDDIESLEIVKKDEYAPKLEIEVKGNEGKDENYKENFGNVENEVKEETENMNENINLEYKDLQSENEVCDVALACDDKQEWTQNLVISDEIYCEENSCQNDEGVVQMDTNLYYEKYVVHEWSPQYNNQDEHFEKEKDEYFIFEGKRSCNSSDEKAFWLYFNECEDCEKRFMCGKSLKSHVETSHEQPGASLLTRSLLVAPGLLDYGHLSVTDVKKLVNKLYLYFFCYNGGKCGNKYQRGSFIHISSRRNLVRQRSIRSC